MTDHTQYRYKQSSTLGSTGVFGDKVERTTSGHLLQHTGHTRLASGLFSWWNCSGSKVTDTNNNFGGIQFLSDELSEVSRNLKLTVQFLHAEFAAVSELSGKKISAEL